VPTGLVIKQVDTLAHEFQCDDLVASARIRRPIHAVLSTLAGA
jgi:hypothetical protein